MTKANRLFQGLGVYALACSLGNLSNLWPGEEVCHEQACQIIEDEQRKSRFMEKKVHLIVMDNNRLALNAILGGTYSSQGEFFVVFDQGGIHKKYYFMN